MTDQINDQISAFIDNELSPEESALLVRRFERDAEARARALRYTLIGSALRGELLEPHPSVLSRRVAAALTGAVPVATRRPERWTARLARPLAGLGIAATVAIVAIGTLRIVNQSPVVVSAAQPSTVPTSGAAQARLDAPSYVVPQGVVEGPITAPPIRLTNYLIHHGVYASGLTRTTVNSNVVGVVSGMATAPAAEGAGSASAKPVAIEDEGLE